MDKAPVPSPCNRECSWPIIAGVPALCLQHNHGADLLSLYSAPDGGEKGSRHGFIAGDGDTHSRPDPEISAELGGGLLWPAEMKSAENRALVAAQFC